MFSFLHSARTRFVAALALGLVVGTVCPARGGEPADGEPAAEFAEAACPAGLDLWVASTRRLPDVCAPPSQAHLAVERLVGQPGSRCWERADLAGLFADPTRPLVIFVHGNRYESADAKEQGLRLARRLTDHGPAGPDPRVVIFSWPSQKQGLLLKDGRRKYERAYADGLYLAWLLGKVPPEQPVALVGYSFGALVVAEALEDLARRSVGIPWAERPGRTHLVFVAPALRFDAFAPRGPFRSGLEGVDRFALLVNSQDEALRFFPLLEPSVRVDAMGYVGIRRDWLPADLEYAASDAAGIVGKLHTMRRYLDSRPLAERIATGALSGLAD